jgi:hypothetical protein
MIVAETEAIARKAAKAVKITYKNRKEPILVSSHAFISQGLLLTATDSR